MQKPFFVVYFGGRLGVKVIMAVKKKKDNRELGVEQSTD